MKVIIAAAGTGGHINPGIAIANKIKEKEPDSEIIFIGTERGIENDLVPRAGYKLKTVDAYGISKKISVKTIKNNIKTIKGFSQAKKIIKEFRPDIVIGTGGYICGGAISSAYKLGIPTVIHESNAYPGKATKFLNKKLTKILLGFKDAEKFFDDKTKLVVTGNPTKVKEEKISEEEKRKILQELGLTTTLPTILVFGGSQGAKAINDAMIPLIKEKKNDKYQIIWSVGPKQYDIIKEEFLKDDIDIDKIKNTKIVPYIYNMSEIMNSIDVIVSRSGAMTITEISLVGKPAIFIPLPSMSANRQVDNAKVLEKLGAAKIILNEEVNSKNLSNTIDKLLQNPEELKQMGKRAKQIATYNVEEKIYDEIKKVVK
ncbi:MAG: undecaprenyldiphospho-muramoylpentapeptide beta-N-acetylglucosaminyltransferase [Clostridia bacterium]|jgi:UDP-N-acetylglucosamine--N-acetylmuramyl-(pentapeptide) pyrophosphoryl-undecaprenol N-acetylglucosamine transferase|nr:undecaprenyldiphospho-muramoylpentapeptide beta-N-acetylglucosaminyltransferase [Clostridia bacterium]